MNNIWKYLKPFVHIYVATIILILACGALSLGAFPAFTLGGTLLAGLAISASAWVFYIAAAMVVCIPLGIKQPGFALSTALGVVAGAAGIVFTGWLWSDSVLIDGFWAATPFALVNTLAVWAFARLTGSLRTDLTFWPQR